MFIPHDSADDESKTEKFRNRKQEQETGTGKFTPSK